MTDTSPQAVFGLSDSDLQRIVEQIEARRQQPGRFTARLRRVAARLAQPSSFNGMGVLLGLAGVSIPDPVWSQASIGVAGLFAIIAVALNDGSGSPSPEQAQ